jgi:hypothetical protein
MDYCDYKILSHQEVYFVEFDSAKAHGLSPKELYF